MTTINISRRNYNQNEYINEYTLKPLITKSLVTSSKNYIRKYLNPSQECGINFLFNRFPILKLIKKYRLKYAARDLLGGITIGAMQIAPSIILV
jgi:hypothetical protein